MDKKKENKSSEINKSKRVDAPEKMISGKIQNCLEFCSDKDNCLSLSDILRSFNAPLSEEQAWSLIYQSVQMYRNFIRIEFIDKHTKQKETTQKSSHRIKVPKSTKNLKLHKDGSVHITDNGELNTQNRGEKGEGKKSIIRRATMKYLRSHTQLTVGIKFTLALRRNPFNCLSIIDVT